MIPMIPYSVDARFFGIEQPALGPYSVVIRQQEYQHDIAEVTIWADNVNSDSYASGMPVQIIYGRPQALRMFYGYVNHAERLNNKLHPATLVEANATVITCMGATWWMKQPDTRVWRNRTIPQVIASIAELFGFDYSLGTDSTVWPTLPMSGMSYWSFCCALAQRLGWTFYGNGIQLVARPRATNPANLTGYVALYDQKVNLSAIPAFTPVVGVNSPLGGQLRVRQMASINPRTGNIATTVVNGNPAPTVLGTTLQEPIFTEIDHYVARSTQEAQSKTGGEALGNQLYIQASALVIGDANIAQGSLVFIKNVNGSQDGLWFVQAATHDFNLSTYALNLQLGRDSMGATMNIGAPPVGQALPKAVLSTSNRWVAA